MSNFRRSTLCSMAESKCTTDSANKASYSNNSIAAGETLSSLSGDVTAKTTVNPTSDLKEATTLSEEDYFRSVDNIRQEMLAISQNSRFIQSRESMMADENGKIFASEDRADKNVLLWIESVRKKIYEIATKFNKPPREVLQQSQVLAKQTLDRDKRLIVNEKNSSLTSPSGALSNKETKKPEGQDDVVIVAEMIKLHDGENKLNSGILKRQDNFFENLPGAGLQKDKCSYTSPQSQLSNIDRIISTIDSKISMLRICIADVQMGLSIEDAASKHRIMPDLVRYEIEHELRLGDITFEKFQRFALQPLRCLQYPERLQEPKYWARLQSAVLAAAKKPLDTCLETAKQHHIGLFHLLAALKEGFKNGSRRIMKEGGNPEPDAPSSSNHSVCEKISSIENLHTNSTPVIAVSPLTNSGFNLHPHSSDKRRTGADSLKIVPCISGVKNNPSNQMPQVSNNITTSYKSQLSISNTPIISALPNEMPVISNYVGRTEMKQTQKEENDDEIMVIADKNLLGQNFNPRHTNHEKNSCLVNNPLCMICNVCQRNFQSWKEYQSHVLSFCLDYDVL